MFFQRRLDRSIRGPQIGGQHPCLLWFGQHGIPSIHQLIDCIAGGVGDFGRICLLRSLLPPLFVGALNCIGRTACRFAQITPCLQGLLRKRPVQLCHHLSVFQFPKPLGKVLSKLILLALVLGSLALQKIIDPLGPLLGPFSPGAKLIGWTIGKERCLLFDLLGKLLHVIDHQLLLLLPKL